MNYLYKNNKSILKTKDNINVYNNDSQSKINNDNINIITSRPNSKIKSKTKKNKTNKTKPNKKISKKTSKKTNKLHNSKQKRTYNLNNTEPNSNNNTEFPQGEKYKCIGPCYPANTLYYNPISLQSIKSKNNSCPIFPTKVGDKIKIKDKCILNENYDFENYDMFDDVVHVATSYNSFLEQIYNIKNIYEMELFLENSINQLPNLSQKRILNSIYKVYRDNDSFPNDNFINLVKNNIIKDYDIKIKSKKILSKIMDNKHTKFWNNLFTGLIK